MKLIFFIMAATVSFGLSSGQQKESENEIQSFEYLDMKEDFDLLVDFTMVNPECATRDKNTYSLIIGTTVIGDYIERISVLVPCLSNEFLRGDLITVHPIRTPKKNIVYTVRKYDRNGQEVSEIFGAEFPAIWGEVVAVL